MTDFILTGGDDVFPAGGEDVSGDDVIVAGAGNDLGHAGAGNDLLIPGGGMDPLSGEAGSDTLAASLTQDAVQCFGGQGDDDLSSSKGNDVLSGGAGNEILHDLGGHDRVFGGSGDDRVDFRASPHDVRDGGAGFDFVRIHVDDRGTPQNPQAVNVAADFSGASWTMTLDGHAGPVLSNFEAIYLQTGTGNDTLLGGMENHSFFSLGGADFMAGGSGNDRLYAAGGADPLLGGADDDVVSVQFQQADSAATLKQLDGGTGFDILEWSDGRSRPQTLTVDLNKGIYSFGIGGVIVATASNSTSAPVAEPSARALL